VTDAIPEITTSSALVVVDELRYRGPLLGLFGKPVWQVRWRRVDNPLVQGVSVLGMGQTAGAAEVAGEAFGFLVHWRRDLRRPIGGRRSDEPREQPGTRPLAALDLANLSSPTRSAQPSAD